MSAPTSLYSRSPAPALSRRQPSQQDLFLYEALVGKSAQLPPDAPAPPTRQPMGGWTWTLNVAQFRSRVRAIYQERTVGQARRPQVVDWLRHLSDVALERLEQAQARLQGARRSPVRRAMDVRLPPAPMQIRRDYKRVA